MRSPGADPAARLLSTKLDVLMAEISDPQRLRRGRNVARQGAVSPFEIAAGVVRADVQGSRAVPYAVEMRVPILHVAPDRPSDLMPSRRELSFRCSCPDDDTPCKHSIALMDVFSDRVAYDPTLLSAWRGVDPFDADDDGGRRPGVERDAFGRAEPQPLDEATRAALDAFLGHPIDLDVPVVAPLTTVQERWDEPWSGMLHDAIEVLRGRHR